MATQTIEPNKELKEASMTTLVAPDHSETRTVYSEDLSPVEAVERLLQVISQLEEELEEEIEITDTAEVMTYVPAPIHRDGLLVGAARQVVAFFDWLSGPPMSDRDRVRCAISDGRYDHYRGI